ncbi:hypothetical protein WMY93_022252 [Mugilogobius chulae]|uniref:Uncharacterized protein n=1 Tax=Mugilogobius chulae TaxID=88201 RepID=A0AAW0N6F4_9GOBI
MFPLWARFGGAVYSPQTGIILNNELADFCGRADAVTPGSSRPLPWTPVVLESRSGGLLVIGGSGGSMITSAVALKGLRALGHNVGNWKYFLNVVNAVEREDGCIWAFSDRRKMGESAGY